MKIALWDNVPILEIPDSGALPKIPMNVARNYLHIPEPKIKKGHDWKIQNGPELDMIIFECGRNEGGGGSVCGLTGWAYNEMGLIFAPTRNEWVAIFIRSEGASDVLYLAQPVILTPYDTPAEDKGWSSVRREGPYAIDDYCQRIITKCNEQTKK